MRQTARRLLGAAALLAVTTVTSGLFATAATAAPTTPVSGDERAKYYDGNVDIGQPGNGCEALGLPGDEMEPPAGIYTKEDPYIDITAQPTGYTITGVFVKGGQGGGGNIYYVDAPSGIEPLGDLPWLDLHPPQNPSGEPAGISHWFICVEKDTTTTTTTTTTTETLTSTSTAATTTSPGTGDTTSVTTTTKAAAAPGSNDQLASTGFGSSWLLVVGLALVAAGAAFVASPKLRGLIKR
jgi:LPXTG-motif cell wall-anchored protein